MPQEKRNIFAQMLTICLLFKIKGLGDFSPGLNFNGAQGRDRTADTRIFSPLLYRLSYLSILSVGQQRNDL